MTQEEKRQFMKSLKNDPDFGKKLSILKSIENDLTNEADISIDYVFNHMHPEGLSTLIEIYPEM